MFHKSLWTHIDKLFILNVTAVYSITWKTDNFMGFLENMSLKDLNSLWQVEGKRQQHLRYRVQETQDAHKK